MNNKIGAKALLPFFVANGLIYALQAVYFSFIPQYLSEIGGKSESEVGLILSVGPFIGIFSLVLVGAAADRAKYKNTVLAVIVIIASLAFSLLQFGNSTVFYIIVLSVMMFFASPFCGLLDAITLEYTTANAVKYGPIRITGTLLYGLISLLLTALMTLFPNTVDSGIIIPAYLIIGSITVVAVFAAPKVQGKAHGKVKVNYGEFFTDKTRVLLMIYVAAAQFAYGCYNNFMPIYLEKTLHLESWIWGVVVLLTVLGEVIFFLKFDTLFKRFSLKSVVLLTTVVMALRYLSFAFLPNTPAILITSLLTGSFITITVYAASYYINLTMKPESRAFGQTIMYSFAFYIPRCLSGFLAGAVVEAFSFETLMAACGILGAILASAAGFFKFADKTAK
ncbi:hypothetical protein FACS1894105_01840 [Clostridia bacterium]|nr:hypothetical protein FACS1894105_01840 [Clostridia bacterium]